MKNLLIIIAVIIAFGVWVMSGTIGKEAARLVLQPNGPSVKKSENFIGKGLLLSAEKLNENAPKMVSDSMRFDKAVADVSALTLTYHNTFTNLSSEHTDFSFLRENLPNAVTFNCSNEDMRWTMSHGAIYMYAYYDSNGNEVARFSISEDDCKN